MGVRRELSQGILFFFFLINHESSHVVTSSCEKVFLEFWFKKNVSTYATPVIENIACGLWSPWSG